jgi:AraC-like DNA-binding protein
VYKLNTDDVPATDRFDYHRTALLQHSSPTEAYCNQPAGFSIRAASRDLGTVALMRMSGHSAGRCGLRRNTTLIRRADPHGYRFLFNPQGCTMMNHNNQDVALTPGDMTLIDTSLPYDAWREAGQTRVLIVEFSQELLPLRRSAVDKLIGARLGSRAGTGALLWTFATRAAQDLDRYRPTEAVQVSTTLLDLLGGLLTHELQTDRSLPPESQQHVIFRQVQMFIQQRLSDPTLSPANIAEAHHISTRTLHRLFEPHGWTVTDWIRSQRLERSRRDLTDPMLDDRPIHAIATRWGFLAASHYTRIFRSCYDLSPQEYRRQAKSARPPLDAK